uniref:Integrase catalytic domain-containing protein n=1 Tax=Tanacetum cinerariifolium TaxID=118510 RepID=A0A6L2K001_TANCI|nr:hypothetical protein [Tanacetum cinerariifolium]
MTGNLKLLCNFVEKLMGIVRYGNDQFASILGYGDMVQGYIMINRVYYFEGLNHNIFLVGHFGDADLEVAFQKSTCFVRDLQGNNLLTDNRGSDHYTISLQESTSSTPLCLMAKALTTQAWLWHRRLSHLNFDYINLLLKKDVVIGLPKLKLVKDQLCSSYELSKAKRSSFKSKAVLNAHVPSQQELDILFGPLYDDFFTAGSLSVNKSSSPIKNSNQQDTQPTTNIQSTSAPSAPTYVHAEKNNDNQAEEEHLHDDEFTNPFCASAKYALEILHKHGMERGQSIGTPMVTKPKLDADLSGNPVDQTDYCSKIKSLMYLTSSRPDIDCAAMSSAEAEYVALSATCAQVMWMRTQLLDYGLNYNNILLYLKMEILLEPTSNKLLVEQPIPPALVVLAGQHVAPKILAAHNPWIKGSKEIDGLMLMTMKPEIQQNLKTLHDHEMLLELDSIAQQAEQELFQTTRDFHSCKQEEGQSVSSYVLKMKGYIDNLEHLGHPVTLGLGKRNCPRYLVELLKKKKNAASGAGGSGVRASRKLKPRALSLYVGNGQREAVEAISIFYLCLPSGLEIFLNNCHYAPSTTRGVISVSRLYEDGFINRFVNNTIQVYFSVIPMDVRNALRSCNMIDFSIQLTLGFLKNGSLCMSRKIARKPYTHQVERAKYLLGLIHTDVCGLFKIMSRQGASYFVTFTDDFSRYGYVYLLKHKHEVFETFKVFQKEVENQLGKTIKLLHFDREGEYMSQEFLDHLKDHGIIAHHTPPYTQQHNGVSERRNRTILDMVRSMMSQTTFPKSFWDYALKTATYILNMVLTKKVEKTPYEVWHGQALKLSYLNVGDYEALVKRDTLTKPKKLEPRSIKCIFIGYPKETIGYSFYYPPENKVLVAQNAKFLENSLINQEASRRDLGELANYKAALLDPESRKWLNAMNVEMQSMKDNEVWVLVELPPNGKIIGSKWLFKKKTDMDGVLQIAAYYDYEVWQMDVKTAFFNGYLNEEVYMEQPEGPKYPNQRHCMENSKRGSIPMQEKLKLSKSQGASTPVELKRMQNVPYASAIGSIMYVVRCTRPDVAFAQNVTSRFQQNLSDLHWTTIKNILKYLRNTKDIGVDRKSAKQSIFAISSAEAEYITAFDASMEAVWVRKFIYGLGVVPTIKEPIKHFHAKVHYLREVIEYGDIKLEKVHTDDNLADPFTKSLAFPKHSKHTRNIGMLTASSLM